MEAIIDGIIGRSKTVLASFVLMLIFGIISYNNVPKEADPDIPIPFVQVHVVHEGISPEDSERLLIRPLEQQLQGLEGLKEINSLATENYAAIFLEFDASFNPDTAVTDVRDKVDLAKPDLPSDAEEPKVQEFNASLFPVIGVTLSGDLPERTLLNTARLLEDRFMQISEISDAFIVGEREELLEVIIDPAKMDSYGVTAGELFNASRSNNRLIAAGAMQGDQSRFSVKVPGLFETRADVLEMPIKAQGDSIVTLGDIAEVRRTFKDVQSIARVNGKPSVAVWAIKRLGENAILATQEVRKVVEESADDIPPGVIVNFTSDQSKWVFETQAELQAAVSTAIVLVMIIVVAALGFRSGFLVGIAIPSSFMFGFVVLSLTGSTINMMVMFGLVLSVGLLVDGAIVVVELADRKMAEGMHRKEAYATASKRMVWPIISSTATTLAAFFPMLAWPGVTGEFMSYLPMTLIYVLSGSLLMALVFMPVLGGYIGKASDGNNKTLKALSMAETGDVTKLDGFTGQYARMLNWVVRRPLMMIGIAILILSSIVVAFSYMGRGVEYFSSSEPDQAVLIVSARGNMSPKELERITIDVEKIVLDEPGISIAFTEVGTELGSRGQELPSDAIATINMEFTEWRTRPKATEILDNIRAKTRNLAGVHVEIYKRQNGPSDDKQINIEFSSTNKNAMIAEVGRVREYLENHVEGVIDIDDSRPLPGIDWRLKIDREQAARFGADVTTVGGVVQLVTNGILIGNYRPDDADDEVDIRVRFPEEDRSIEALDKLRLSTPSGPVPISNFVTTEPAPRLSSINKSNGRIVMNIKANPDTGYLADTQVRQVAAWLETQEIHPDVSVAFRGTNEEQQESAEFLGGALLFSLFLMGIILVTQFNSFYHAFLILTSIVLSTVGVLLGMMIRDQTFSVIMTGTGIIALAGIVVNNNIVLVDTYQRLHASGQNVVEAIVRTGAQRLRPVLLTTITTICGILPMAYSVNVDFFARQISYDAPTSGWWVQLATAIVFGLAFATVLTLVITPCMLALPDHVRQKYGTPIKKLLGIKRPNVEQQSVEQQSPAE